MVWEKKWAARIERKGLRTLGLPDAQEQEQNKMGEGELARHCINLNRRDEGILQILDSYEQVHHQKLAINPKYKNTPAGFGYSPRHLQ
jgi:hypothetical protein